MKKFLISLLVLLGLQTQTQAQINFCDSISYTTTSTINYPLIVSGDASPLINIADSITWSWSVCNSSMCYIGSGQNASFGQVYLTDTLKVCYDVYITINNMSYVCTGCDSLVYNPNSYQWEAMTAQPLSITELKSNTINDGRMYDMLGRELFEVPVGTMYIQNRKLKIRK